MSHSIPPISDEMLSAYLDEELSAEQRARVDAALAASPQLQSTLAELEQIRGDLKALPAYTLPPDFAQRITDALHTQSANPSTARVETATWTRGKHARWILGVAASAAIILLSLTLFPPQTQRRVASSRRSNVDALHLADERLLAESTPAPQDWAAAGDSSVRLHTTDGVEPPAQMGSFNFRYAAPTEFAERFGDMDAIVSVSLTTNRLAELDKTRQDSDVRAQRQDRDFEAEKAFFLKSSRARLLETPDRVDYWVDALGVPRPDRVLEIEGTASQITLALQDLAARQAKTVSVKDSETARALALNAPIMKKQPNVPIQKRAMAFDAGAEAPRFAPKGPAGGFAGQTSAETPRAPDPAADASPTPEELAEQPELTDTLVPEAAAVAVRSATTKAEPQGLREEKNEPPQANRRQIESEVSQSAISAKDEQSQTESPRRYRVIVLVHEGPG